jgi:hypothetical protein
MPLSNPQDDPLFASILRGTKLGGTSIPKDTQAFLALASRGSEAIVASLNRRLTKSLRAKRRYRRQFERRLFDRWQKPVDLLEILIEVCLQAGARLKDTSKSSNAVSHDYLFHVLRKLHARSCQISYEILCLLKAGFADGAHARWRTLYEIAVISYFIHHQGQECAKRYLQYEIVENYKEMLEYQQHCSQLGYEPLADSEIIRIGELYDNVIKTYGRSFGKPYGWIPDNILKGYRTFAGIEKFERFDKLRPYYIMACHNVHSGPKAITFRLGIFKRGRHKTVLLAGGSNYGLADPGQGAAISLSQITSCLLSTRPTIRNIISMMVTLRLVDEIRSAFVDVQIEKEERIASVNESRKDRGKQN